MLKKKLVKNTTNKVVAGNIIEQVTNSNISNSKTSHLFRSPLWENVFKLECQLNEKLKPLKPDGQLTHIYNPIEYAAQLHCEYLRKFLKGTKKLLFIGMNPGHDGMGQTGFYNLEKELNEKLRNCETILEITYFYNPIVYAADLHCNFLKKYLYGQKKVLFIGMNPGPHGMVQTGVPFGNISTVKNAMGLSGVVDKPQMIHTKRPINGLEHTREEPSGKRLWNLFQKLSNDSLETFFVQCFVHNFCPLAFFNCNGNNITPSELKGPYKQLIRETCLDSTEQVFELIQPEIIVAVGSYVYEALKKSKYCKNKRLLLLAHPSPRSLNNNNWPEKAEHFLIKEDLIKYLRNERSTT